MPGTLKGYLALLAYIFYFLAGLLEIGLVVNFIWSLLKRDLSPWWFWPAGIVAGLVLMVIAGNLLRFVDRQD